MGITDSGILYQYQNWEGKTQTAKALHIEQTPAYKDNDRVLLRLINDDHSDKLNKKGQKMIAVKHLDEIEHIGFID